MKIIPLAFLALSLSLGACADAEWANPSGAAQVDQDYQACLNDVGKRYNYAVNQTMTDGSPELVGLEWVRAHDAATRRYFAAMNGCMAAKGNRRVVS